MSWKPAKIKEMSRSIEGNYTTCRCELFHGYNITELVEILYLGIKHNIYQTHTVGFFRFYFGYCKCLCIARNNFLHLFF